MTHTESIDDTDSTLAAPAVAPLHEVIRGRKKGWRKASITRGAAVHTHGAHAVHPPAKHDGGKRIGKVVQQQQGWRGSNREKRERWREDGERDGGRERDRERVGTNTSRKA
jgi:hypothetical protein